MKYEQMDQYQRLVIEAESNYDMRIIGCPGAGKTETLVQRYSYLVNHYGLIPSKILTVTYSKKAADEMAGRISQLVPLNDTARRNISTIHAFCYRTLNESLAANGEPKYRMWSYGDRATNPVYKASEFLNKYCKSSDLSLFDRANSLMKSTPVSQPEKLNAITDQPQALYTAWQEYHRYMEDNKLIDYPGQLWEVQKLLTTKRHFPLMLGRRFDKIIVDEAQDMGQQTFDILISIANYTSIELYGDPAQSIYGFMGATPEFLDNFVTEAIPNIRTFYLLNNYRSAKSIVDLANDFGPKTSQSFQPMNKTKQEEGRIIIGEAQTIEGQGDYIKRQIDDGLNPGEIYVLARSNAECQLIHQRLLDLNVPSYCIGNYSLWDKSHVKAAMSYWSLSEGQDTPDAVGAVLNIPSEYFVNNKGVYCPTRFLSKREFEGVYLADIDADSDKLKPFQRNGVKDLKAFVNKLAGCSPRERTDRIESSLMKYLQYSGLDYQTASDDLSILWDKLENLGYSLSSLQRYIMKVKADRRKVRPGENKVYVMTIHQAKGLQKQIVFVTGLSEPIDGEAGSRAGFHPGQDTPQSVSESNCLYYTAITRAIASLHLTYYTVKGDNQYTLSSFITPEAINIVKRQTNGKS